MSVIPLQPLVWTYPSYQLQLILNFNVPKLKLKLFLLKRNSRYNKDKSFWEDQLVFSVFHFKIVQKNNIYKWQNIPKKTFYENIVCFFYKHLFKSLRKTNYQANMEKKKVIRPWVTFQVYPFFEQWGNKKQDSFHFFKTR
jgi:hypothetical protein